LSLEKPLVRVYTYLYIFLVGSSVLVLWTELQVPSFYQLGGFYFHLIDKYAKLKHSERKYLKKI